MDHETKTCTKCNQTKPIDDYHWRNRTKGMRRRECKACAQLVKSAHGKADYKVNRAYYDAKNARWFKENADYMKTKRRERYLRDKDKVRVQARAYQKERRETDIEYRLKCILRSRSSEAVRMRKTCKANRTLTLLGCTTHELKAHLEARFYRGMTWDTLGNGMGTWQVDHITPLGLFDLTRRDQQLQAFHYTNLQPLWWDDHQRKSVVDNRYIRTKKECLKPRVFDLLSYPLPT